MDKFSRTKIFTWLPTRILALIVFLYAALQLDSLNLSYQEIRNKLSPLLGSDGEVVFDKQNGVIHVMEWYSSICRSMTIETAEEEARSIFSDLLPYHKVQMSDIDRIYSGYENGSILVVFQQNKYKGIRLEAPQGFYMHIATDDSHHSFFNEYIYNIDLPAPPYLSQKQVDNLAKSLHHENYPEFKRTNPQTGYVDIYERYPRTEFLISNLNKFIHKSDMPLKLCWKISYSDSTFFYLDAKNGNVLSKGNYASIVTRNANQAAKWVSLSKILGSVRSIKFNDQDTLMSVEWINPDGFTNSSKEAEAEASRLFEAMKPYTHLSMIDVGSVNADSTDKKYYTIKFCQADYKGFELENHPGLFYRFYNNSSLCSFYSNIQYNLHVPDPPYIDKSKIEEIAATAHKSYNEFYYKTDPITHKRIKIKAETLIKLMLAEELTINGKTERNVPCWCIIYPDSYYVYLDVKSGEKIWEGYRGIIFD